MVKRLSYTGLLVLLCASCAAGIEDDPELEAEQEVKVAAMESGGRQTLIHIGGICSQRFADADSKGGGWLASLDGIDSVDARVDQSSSMAVAVDDLRGVLDEHCQGANWCHLYAYSNGAAVVSKTLASYSAERWNIMWSLHTAGNEGGSELASGLADFGSVLGVTCDLAANVSPSDHRSGWNHNDTAGNTLYHIGGYDEWWYTGSAPDFFGGDSNDGVVANHSSAGMNKVYSVPDDDPWWCYTQSAHWDNHKPAYRCEGYDLDHHEMKVRGLYELGG